MFVLVLLLLVLLGVVELLLAELDAGLEDAEDELLFVVVLLEDVELLLGVYCAGFEYVFL